MRQSCTSGCNVSPVWLLWGSGGSQGAASVSAAEEYPFVSLRWLQQFSWQWDAVQGSPAASPAGPSGLLESSEGVTITVTSLPAGPAVLCILGAFGCRNYSELLVNVRKCVKPWNLPECRDSLVSENASRDFIKLSCNSFYPESTLQEAFTLLFLILGSF